MSKTIDFMRDFSNWTEISKGYYRYVTSTGVFYEIVICRWYHDSDILTASAWAFVVGDRDMTGWGGFLDRECLNPTMRCLSVSECIDLCVEYYEETNEQDI